MQDRSNQQQPDPQKEFNPDTLAASDEAQRQKQGEHGKQDISQQVPTGNEPDEQTDTEGTKAGMGE